MQTYLSKVRSDWTNRVKTKAGEQLFDWSETDCKVNFPGNNKNSIGMSG